MQTSINLMTPETQARLRRLDGVRRASAWLSGLLLLAAPIGIYYLAQSRRLSNVVAARELDYGFLWRTRVEIEGLQRKQRTLTTDQRELLDLSCPRQVTTLLACVAEAVARQEGTLRVRQWVLDPLRPRLGAPEAQGRLSLEVEAYEGADLDAFVRDLDRPEMWEFSLAEVELVAGPTGSLRKCQLECRF